MRDNIILVNGQYEDSMNSRIANWKGGCYI